MNAPLTEKQKAFAIAYVNNGGNRTQAAISAGYSTKVAKQSGYQALTSPAVQAAKLCGVGMCFMYKVLKNFLLTIIHLNISVFSSPPGSEGGGGNLGIL